MEKRKKPKMNREDKIKMIKELRHDREARQAFSHKMAKVVREQMLYIFDVAENEGFDQKKRMRTDINIWTGSFQDQLLELLDYVSGDFGDTQEEPEETVEEKIERWNILDLNND